ncbi:hypothetical protein [Roseimaritima sediminicola]|uniref:hypothetical protein n=1 Tax=Roseimaritima sediminicola TaxID=2662066 RepID=UPI0012982EC2|nr:hypothetical protein [Roseimaritima sediminicola]
MLEDEFESQVLANAGEIFPGYRAIPFKQTVNSPEFGTAKPDFLIFDQGFRSWWVIEVEMSRHSLAGHVEPQVAALSHATFTDHHIAKVGSFYSEQAEAEQVSSLMRSVQANVLVVVNEPCDHWRGPLRQYDASLISVVPYQSRQGTFIFRQFGSLPGDGTSVLSTIQIRRDISRAIIVDNRSALPFQQQQEIEVLIDDTPTRWRCHFMANTLMLFCLGGRFPFNSSAGNYVLVRLTTGEYAIEKYNPRIVGNKS